MSNFQVHQISVDCFGIEYNQQDLDIRMIDMAFLLMGIDFRQLINRKIGNKTVAVVMSNGHDTLTAHAADGNMIITVTGNKYTDVSSVHKIVEQSFKPKRIRVSHITHDMSNTNQVE